MNLFTIQKKKTISIPKFIDFWSQFYYYKLENKYIQNIDAKTLDICILNELFFWKNVRPLSRGQKESLKNIDIEKINNLRYNFDLNQFEEEYKRISAIWKIFLLHIIDHDFPIFDKHTYRSFSYITTNTIKELDNYHTAKYEIYKSEYVPFFIELKNEYLKYNNIKNVTKKIDEALFTFGKFLVGDFGSLFIGS